MIQSNYAAFIIIPLVLMKSVVSLAFFFLVVDYIFNRLAKKKRVYIDSKGIHRFTYFSAWTVKFFTISLILWLIPVTMFIATILE